MNNRKTTKKALLMSALSLLLCFSMLIGTTFAWFTDEVKSGTNQIIAGNLDVEVYHGKEANPATNKVQSATNLFVDENGNPIQWEPGVVAYTNINVVNEGTLALKYQFGINFDNENYIVGTNAKLSQVLKVAFLENPVSGTREQILEVAKTSGVLLSNLMKTGALEAEANKVYGIVIYWEPSADDNNWNVNNGKTTSDGQPLHIDLGIKLVATQKTAESDSFGPDYDEDAWAEGWKVNDAQGLQAAINNGKTEIILEEDIKVDEPIIIPAASTTFSLRTTPAIKINLNGKTITTAYNEETNKHAYAIDNYGNVEIYGGTIKARGIYNREGATLTVNGTKIVNLDTNGGSCVWSYGGSVVLNNAELIGYTGCVYSDGYLEINGGTYTCYSAVLDDGTQLTPTYNIRSNGELVINGGDFTSRHGLVSVKGSAVINGGTYTMTSIGTITSHVFYVYGTDANVTVNGGIFNCDLRTAQANGSSMICVDATNVTVAVKGGTFNLTPAKYVADGYKAVKVGENYLIIASDREYIADGVQMSTDGKTYYISNVAGWNWMDAQADNFFLNKTVALDADIDFGGATLTSVKFWNGKATVDGQNYTLSNFVIAHSGSKTPSGLFGGTLNVKNLIVDNANVTGDYAGVIAGNMYGDIVNCTVKNSVINGTYWQSGALVGQYNAGNITGCVVEDCEINGLAAVGGLVGILNETAGERKIENCTMKNNVITQTGSFGGDYDNMFGVAVGLINIDNSTVYFNNCTMKNNTMKTQQSAVLYGENSDSTTVIINGATAVRNAAELQAALVAGGNVVLVADIQATNVVTLAEISGVTATLDLNGHNIDATLNGADGWSQIFRVSKGATFTVVGEGNVHATAYATLSYGSVIFNNVGGNLIINGGNYTMTYGSYAEGYLLPAIIDTNSNTEKATTTINGGTFTHTRNMFRNFAQPQRGENNATLIINGGTFIGKADDYATIWNQKTNSNGVDGDGIVIITGGEFNYVNVDNEFQTGVTIADGIEVEVI